MYSAGRGHNAVVFHVDTLHKDPSTIMEGPNMQAFQAFSLTQPPLRDPYLARQQKVECPEAAG